MRPWILLVAALLAALTRPACASLSAEVSVYDPRNGHELPIYLHQGRRYIAGEPGQVYEIRIRNRSGGRVLAVTSVDGVNVLSGDTAAPDQAGYVVGAYAQTRIEGWRKSLDEVASFHFTRLADSYAARTGRSDEVGVIGVALFREKPAPCCDAWRRPEEPSDEAPGPRAQAPSAARGAEPAATTSAGTAAPMPLEKAERLGTGHGMRRASVAQQVAFERASHEPEQIVAIWYDSRANLLAQGVIPSPPRAHRRRAEPFPERGFVPDP